MIGYRFNSDGEAITEESLREAIEIEKPNWLARAEERTDSFINAGRYNERSGIWSEIKSLYMRLQHNKCAYCERILADGGLGGTIEHDLEHFRPKNSVPKWPSRRIADERDIDYDFETGDSLANGYYWLAYDPSNYCTSCKKCNSPLKKNYFPVAGPRGSIGNGNPDQLNETEKPFLLNPVGTLDELPEDIITFDGLIPIPATAEGRSRDRAEVVIDFFELDTREELLRGRASVLVALSNALRLLEISPTEDEKAQARRDIERLRESSSAHSSCVHAACGAYVKNRERMLETFVLIRDFLDENLA